MEISLSSYSLYHYMRLYKKDIFDAVDKAHEMGFPAMEFIEIPGTTYEEQAENAKKIREKLDGYNMKVTAFTICADFFLEGEEFEEEFRRLKDQLEIAKILGAPLMRHDAVRKNNMAGIDLPIRSFDLALPLMAENMRRVSEYAKTLGIKTCVENHGRLVQDSERLERLFNMVNHDNFGLLVDMGNFLCVDDDPIKAVSRLAPYAIHVHAKDMFFYSGEGHHPGAGSIITRGGNWIRCTVIGQGSVPVKQCLRILKFAGYKGALGLEFEGCEEPIDGITKGYANLKRYLSELEEE